MTVMFCGHREIVNKEEVKLWLDRVVVELVNQGADRFLNGGYGQFDRLAMQSVWQAKDKFPFIKQGLVLAYLNREYDLKYFDYTEYPPIEKVPLKFAISERNKYMAEQSDVVVAFVEHNWGGAYKTLEYAKKLKKKIIEYKATQ